MPQPIPSPDVKGGVTDENWGGDNGLNLLQYKTLLSSVIKFISLEKLHNLGRDSYK